MNISNGTSYDRNPDWGPQPDPAPAKVAFASNRDGNFEIYSMNTDGSGQTRLTTSPAVDISPDAP